MPAARDDAVRVVTLNVDGNRATLAERLPLLGPALRALEADVVCLQEAAVPEVTDSFAAVTDVIARKLGFTVAAQAQHQPGPFGGDEVAILTRLPVNAAHETFLGAGGGFPRRRWAAAAEVVSDTGRVWLVATAHLAWGGEHAADRLDEAVALDRWVRAIGDPDAVRVLAGDFNALPDETAVRWLEGLDASVRPGTYWTDAWRAAGVGAGVTSTAANARAAQTAALVGIANASMLPERRIDYVMVRPAGSGWAYGRPGCPLAAHVVELGDHTKPQTVPSDHHPVIADLWDPPLTS